MTETDQRPARKRATIHIDIEGGEVVVKGKWMDENGKRHDLGFAKLPTWAQAVLMLEGMGRRLSSIAGNIKGEDKPL